MNLEETSKKEFRFTPKDFIPIWGMKNYERRFKKHGSEENEDAFFERSVSLVSYNLILGTPFAIYIGEVIKSYLS